MIGNPLAIYRGLSGPAGPKPQKSLKNFSWASGRAPAPGPPESLEKVSKTSFRNVFETFSRLLRLVIFFSLTEAPLPDPDPNPTQHPEMDPKRTRNKPETDPNGPEGTRKDQNQALWGGTAGGFVGMGGGVGVVREKENHYSRLSRPSGPKD